MSIERCSRCENKVDSDKDGDCYVYVGNYKRQHDTVVMCEGCRSRHWDEIEYQEFMTP